MIDVFFKSPDKRFTIVNDDCLAILRQFNFHFDMIFADPPYFLSNGGISVQNGRMVSVNKGNWDKSHGFWEDNRFTNDWLRLCRDKLAEHGTIWISGTFHNIFSVAQQLTELQYRILNVITWVKTNPPPNLSCRYFTHSTEFIIWARKSEKCRHYFNYELMKKINGGKQMRDVWHFPAIARWEKHCGKHPTQKPLSLLCRIILASTQENAWILDPFSGSGTTGIAANLLNRKYLGIEKERDFAIISKERYQEYTDNKALFSQRLSLPANSDDLSSLTINEDPLSYGDNILV